MATFIKLKQTPIKEIIFTISFKENVEISKLDVFKSIPVISTMFPIVSKGFQTQVNAKSNIPPTTKVSADGYILRSGNPASKIIQARRGSLSLHKLNGYENFDTLINEFQTYWNLLVDNCGQLSVNALTVRYLNFIELNQSESINDFLTINVKHPFGERVKNSFTQHRFKYEKEPSINITIVSSLGKSDGKEGIILDIILNNTVEVKDNKFFNFNNFSIMREVKNDLFFKCITEKTINKYNQ